MYSGSQYAVPDWPEIPQLILEWLKHLPEQHQKLHPVEFAAEVHKDFVFIHPFVDGNGRVARLLTNLVLLQAGYLIVIIPPITRADYISSLEKAHTDASAFRQFIAARVLETQKDYLRLLK
ncbi:MAG: Fic family protein [Negativicutes bacterium]|nr:Fic family protein [Negativicutes bacterium]